MEKDFVFDLKNAKPVTTGFGGEGRFANIDTFPVLKDEKVSNALFSINPCAQNTPHVHPRGTEIFYVIQGTFKTFFVEENGGRVIVNDVSAGQTTIFPQGLIHGQINTGCEQAIFLAAFGTEDPGVQQTANNLFRLPVESLTSAFYLTKDKIDVIKLGIPDNPANGFDSECLARCGISNPVYTQQPQY